ncbi:zinc-binding alcohol dehydrogenase family protein [Spirosoma sp. KUDC1026]|uniref:quinone oxidoreductase family protein n=1 Tax=Spirosoma sp. KUDC1026 TaxID=2745947 RepID=UPI00159BA696|nr:zinc-binding alcohol dehydrogenase family protein [Spirosoma sp. KUDC1026]QKZ13852.1 zinc-binding alcohol dehydrogenase family protein [Spirosoma sp. KUDC1026]
MKAAVLHQLGEEPRYEDFPDPVPQEGQLLLRVKAAAVKNLDKARASGKHYASHQQLPTVVGIDGVGLLDDGRRVYATGLSGMLAEKALVSLANLVPIPDTLSDATAAALPNAVMGAALALLHRAQLKAGMVVLINGATGVTGQVAVQLARYYGANRVIVTGRNAESLEKLKTLGADEIISLRQDDESLIHQLKAAHAATPVDVVIDYLWGHPMEMLLKALMSGGINQFTHPVRIVTVGSMAGETIGLSSGSLRSSAIEILGSGLGSLSADAFRQMNTDILPDLFQLATTGGLILDTDVRPLADVATAWNQDIAPGKRLVIQIA